MTLEERLAALEQAEAMRAAGEELRARRYAAFLALSPAERLAVYQQRTATTTPDGLPYPDDYTAPADSPAAFQALAEATQAALNGLDVLTADYVTPATGWELNGDVYGAARTEKMGRLVVTRGRMKRTTALTVADNGSYLVGTIAEPFRPWLPLSFAVSWRATDDRGVQDMTTTCNALATGELYVVSNVVGTLAVGQWVSLAGVAWWTKP